MPGFLKILKKWLIASYDNLGLVLLCSVVWFGVGTVFIAPLVVFARSKPLLFVSGVSAIYVLVLSPITAGVFFIPRGMLSHESPSAMDLPVGIRKYYVRGWALGVTQLAVTVGLLLNARFYIGYSYLPVKCVGIVFIYLLILWAMSSLYHYPLLVEQQIGTFSILKKGFFLAMGSFGFTVGLFFVIILLACVCLVARILLPLVCVGMAGILETMALRALLVKYGVLEPEPPPIDEGFHV